MHEVLTPCSQLHEQTLLRLRQCRQGKGQLYKSADHRRWRWLCQNLNHRPTSSKSTPTTVRDTHVQNDRNRCIPFRKAQGRVSCLQPWKVKSYSVNLIQNIKKQVSFRCESSYPESIPRLDRSLVILRCQQCYATEMATAKHAWLINPLLPVS